MRHSITSETMVEKPVSFVEKQCLLKSQAMSKLVGSLGSHEKKRY